MRDVAPRDAPRASASARRCPGGSRSSSRTAPSQIADITVAAVTTPSRTGSAAFGTSRSPSRSSSRPRRSSSSSRSSLLGALWQRAAARARAARAPPPATLSAASCSRARCACCSARSRSACSCSRSRPRSSEPSLELLNFAPTFILRDLLARAPAALGDSSGTCGASSARGARSPTRPSGCSSAADAGARRCSSRPSASAATPPRVALFAFVALELAHPRPAYPRTLGVAVAAVHATGRSPAWPIYGRDTWTRCGEGFAVAFGLSRAHRAVRGPRRPRRRALAVRGARGRGPDVAARSSSSRCCSARRASTASAGRRSGRTSLGDVRAPTSPDEPAWLIDLATTLVNLGGLAAFVGAVVVTYLAATETARRLVHAPRSLVPDFVLPLVPIAFAYLVAHYFSQFVIQGQFMFSLDLGPVRAGLGSLRNGRLRAEPRARLAGDGLVRAGRLAHGRARRRPRDRARPRGRAVREPRATLYAPSTRCSR